PWASSFFEPTGDLNWIRQIDATEDPGAIVYPIGSGPLSQSGTRNAYRLPSGYLRSCPRDPTAGNFSPLGAPANLLATDWTYENGCIVTRETKPLAIRFVTDMQDVSKMDDMFCEMLSCRIGLEICEALTQSGAK